MNKHHYKAVFIDKDGTLIPDIPYNVDPAKITLYEGALEGLNLLRSNGFKLVMISNQAGVARGYFEEKDLEGVKEKITALLKEGDVSFDGYYFCPHHPEGKVAEYAITCECRKPAPGMILKAAKDLNIDLSSSYMIGDILNDVEAGKTAGCKAILIDNGNETEWILNENRTPDKVVKSLKEAAEWVVQQR